VQCGANTTGVAQGDPCLACGCTQQLVSVSDSDHGSGAEGAPTIHLKDFDAGLGLETRMFVDGQGQEENTRDIRPGDDVHDSGATRRADGSMSESISGKVSPKKERELRAAWGLIERLNKNGGNWGPPSSCDARRERTGEREDGVDCLSLGPGTARLAMQVVTPERTLWETLAKKGSASRSAADNSKVLDAMLAAIQAKSALDGRQSIALVLEATDMHAYALRSVVKEFREKHLGDVAACGWESVWVVGPIVDLVHRLDV
jgi:hypothetical protein